MVAGTVDRAQEEAEDAVHFLTVHKAKGLQFDYVIIPHVTNGFFPMLFPPGPREKLRSLFSGKKPDNRGMEEEERRVFYVALTRAAKGAFLFTTPGNRSPYLKELGPCLAKTKAPPIKRTVASKPGKVLRASHSELYDFNFCPGRYRISREFKFAGMAIQPLFEGLSLHRGLEVIHRLSSEKSTLRSSDLDRIFARCSGITRRTR